MEAKREVQPWDELSFEGRSAIVTGGGFVTGQILLIEGGRTYQ